MKHIGSITIVAYPVINGEPMLDHPCNIYYHFYDNDHLEYARTEIFETLIKFHTINGYQIQSDSKGTTNIFAGGRNNRVIQFKHPTENKAPIIMLQYEEFEANHSIQDIAKEFLDEGAKVLSDIEDKPKHIASIINFANYKKNKDEVSDNE
jgi:hypothetical protein